MSIQFIDDFSVMMTEEEEIKEEEESIQNHKMYIENTDIRNSFRYIHSLPFHSKEIISFYNTSATLNSIYNKDKQNQSCNDINLIDKIFEESPVLENELRVYRGLTIVDGNVNLELDRLISTSTTYKIAEEFLNDDMYDRKFILDIRLKPGVKFLAISLPGTMFESEHEILLPPGGSFTVVKEEIKRMFIWNNIFQKMASVPITILKIEYVQKQQEIDCEQQILSETEQYDLLMDKLINENTTLADSFLESYIDSGQSGIKELIRLLHDMFRKVLILTVLKNNSIERHVVYRSYLSAISFAEERVLDYLKSRKLSKYNKILIRETNKLKTLIQIDKLSNGKLFMFDQNDISSPIKDL
jgi:hypothetical protein